VYLGYGYGYGYYDPFWFGYGGWSPYGWYAPFYLPNAYDSNVGSGRLQVSRAMLRSTLTATMPGP